MRYTNRAWVGTQWVFPSRRGVLAFGSTRRSHRSLLVSFPARSWKFHPKPFVYPPCKILPEAEFTPYPAALPVPRAILSLIFVFANWWRTGAGTSACLE